MAHGGQISSKKFANLFEKIWTPGPKAAPALGSFRVKKGLTQG
jgi:hypothetical protein